MEAKIKFESMLERERYHNKNKNQNLDINSKLSKK